VARSFVDLIRAIAAPLGEKANIEFVDMPESIRANYQYFTQADMHKLVIAGYDKKFHTLEDGVAHYVTRYLTQADIYR
jgi:ADP-L-glycero-D-manno-heptose 6-epimerase